MVIFLACLKMNLSSFFLTKEGHHYGNIKAIIFATHITYKNKR